MDSVTKHDNVFLDIYYFFNEFPFINDLIIAKLKLAQLYYESGRITEAFNIYKDVRYQKSQFNKYPIDLCEASNFFVNNWNILESRLIEILNEK